MGRRASVLGEGVLVSGGTSQKTNNVCQVQGLSQALCDACSYPACCANSANPGMWGLQKQDERKQAARCRECANARHSEIVRERYAVTARARYVVKELQHVMYKEDPQSVEDDLPMITNNWRFSKEHKQFPTVRHRGMETGISEASKRVSIPLLPREASK